MMMNLPLAVVGGVAGVFLAGGVLSLASIVGFITLFGIATPQRHYVDLPCPPSSGTGSYEFARRRNARSFRTAGSDPYDGARRRACSSADCGRYGQARQRDSGSHGHCHLLRAAYIYRPEHGRRAGCVFPFS